MQKDYVDIIIEPNGDVRFIHDDDVAELFDGDDVDTRRASNVEPHPAKTGWLADMGPSGGPVIGANGVADVMPEWRFRNAEDYAAIAALEPFKRRADALSAELDWLRTERGL